MGIEPTERQLPPIPSNSRELPTMIVVAEPVAFWNILFLAEPYRNGGAGIELKINQTASSASPSPPCSSSLVVMELRMTALK